MEGYKFDLTALPSGIVSTHIAPELNAKDLAYLTSTEKALRCDLDLRQALNCELKSKAISMCATSIGFTPARASEVVAELKEFQASLTRLFANKNEQEARQLAETFVTNLVAHYEGLRSKAIPYSDDTEFEFIRTKMEMVNNEYLLLFPEEVTRIPLDAFRQFMQSQLKKSFELYLMFGDREVHLEKLFEDFHRIQIFAGLFASDHHRIDRYLNKRKDMDFQFQGRSDEFRANDCLANAEFLYRSDSMLVSACQVQRFFIERKKESGCTIS